MTARRVLSLALLAGTVLAAGVTGSLLDIYATPNAEEFQRNYERWLAMDADERAEIQERWAVWQGMDVDKQRVLKARMQTLRRLRWRMQTADPQAARRVARAVEVSRLALERELQRLHEVAAVRSRRSDVDGKTTRKLFQEETRRSLDAFLDDLVGLELLTDGERAGLASLSTKELVERALMLRKNQHLRDVAAIEGDAEVADLRGLEPLEVMHHADKRRAERGFTGSAGRRVFGLLSAEQRVRIAGAYADGDWSVVRDIVLPHVVTILEREGVPESERDRYLAMPFNRLERHLNTLLTREAPKRPDTDGDELPAVDPRRARKP